MYVPKWAFLLIGWLAVCSVGAFVWNPWDYAGWKPHLGMACYGVAGWLASRFWSEMKKKSLGSSAK